MVKCWGRKGNATKIIATPWSAHGQGIGKICWKKNLDTLSIEFIDFICAFEMSLFGYKVNNLNLVMSEERFKSYFEMDCNVSLGWRCKHQDYATEYQNQLNKKLLLF